MNISAPDTHLVSLAQIMAAQKRLKKVVVRTPLLNNPGFSEKLGCDLWFKREDLQVVRSYKLRGAYNKMAQLSEEARKRGIVCASAGNHAQGVAYACHRLGIFGKIFMPITTPSQKIQKVNMFGKEFVEIILIGDTFDEASQAADIACTTSNSNFIHPFDDAQVIAGQGTVGMEIIMDADRTIDYLILPIGGGGLSAGVGSYFRQVSPETKIIGVEPAGAAAMWESFQAGKVHRMDTIDPFVDGAAVQQVGALTYPICREVIDEIIRVPEGHVCTTILQLYNEEAIVVEPAGALSVAALSLIQEEIQGKHVVCIISGGNNDILRMEEIKERSLLHQGLKHYFLISFPQRVGALREFLEYVLGPGDDITHFEYTKKNNRGKGPALVGLELQRPEDYASLIERMDARNVDYKWVNNDPILFGLLV